MVVVVRAQQPAESSAVHDVVAAAFADVAVAQLWDDLALRPGTVSIVAVDSATVVGHVGLSWGWVDARERLVDVLVLSPLSVAPERQRLGIGRSLVESAVATAAALGSPVLFLEGDPAYYSRLGFVEAALHGFTPPSARIPLPAFQCVLLPAYDASVQGALVYPDVFWSHDSVGLRGKRLEQFDL